MRHWFGLEHTSTDGGRLDLPSDRIALSEALFSNRVHGWGQCFAAFDGRYTLIEAGSSLRMFDRRSDPGERKPLSMEGHPNFEPLDRALLAMRTGGYGGSSTGIPIESVTPYGFPRRANATYLARPKNARLPDPQPHLLSWASLTNLSNLMGLHAQRRDATALRLVISQMEKLTARMPPTPYASHVLGRAKGLLAGVTGDKEMYRAAWKNMFTAIEAGYMDIEHYRAALLCALRAKSSDFAGTTLNRMIEDRVAPDMQTAKIILELARAGLTKPEVSRAALTQAVTRTADDRSQVAKWIKMIR